MKKIVIFLMSLILVVNLNAQKHVPYGQQIGVVLQNSELGDNVTVDIVCDTAGTVYDITGNINIELKNDNFNPNNKYFTTVVGKTVDWTLGTNYKIIINDNDTIKVNSVPFANVAQHLAETNFGNGYIKILHNGEYLYVDVIDSLYAGYGLSSQSNAATFCTGLNLVLETGETLTGQLTSLSELKSITNQIYKFKTSTDDTNSSFYIDYTNGNYWVSDDATNSYNIITLQKVSTTEARARCVFK